MNFVFDETILIFLMRPLGSFLLVDDHGGLFVMLFEIIS